jgi:NADP-dependent 3-hydroxy acid dehydrogenase YdfG
MTEVARPLAGKVALVTGASSGIGAATAVALARAGAAVAIGARRQDRLDGLAQDLRDDGVPVLPLELDVTDEAACADAVRRTREELGGLDVLVNNAGVMLLGPVEGADTEEWRRMVNVNLLGLLYCTHAALPLMRESGGGHVVNVSSVAGRTAAAGSAVYNLTKWGVTGFSEGLRQEALHSGVRVTCVEPGFVETELQGHNTNPVVRDGIEKMRGQIGDVLKSEDIANAIVYAVAQPDRVNVNEVLIRPTGQQR